MGEQREAFVGIDVAKGRNAIAVADGERGGQHHVGRLIEGAPHHGVTHLADPAGDVGGLESYK